MRASQIPIYYGWLVLAASAISEMLATGATSYASGLFVLPLQGEFHISRAAASSAVLILFLGCAVTAPQVGRILDRVAMRKVVSLGALVFCGALAGIALAPSLGIMALLLLVAGAGFAAIGPLSTNTLASRWFFRRRGLALGLAAVATSGGGFVVVPLLSRGIQAMGWRQALLWEALILAVLIVTVALAVIRDNPAATGLSAHPENRGRENATNESVAMRWRDILASRVFWLAALTMSLVSATCQAMVVTLVPYGIQLGNAVASMALLVGGFSICAGVTKVVAGLLSDRMELRWLLALSAALMTAAWLALLVSPAFASLMAAACLSGIALGCALPASAALIANAFGAARFGSVMGWAYALLLALLIIVVLFAGIVFDKAGSYQPAFLTFAVMLAGLLLAILLLPISSRDAPV